MQQLVSLGGEEGEELLVNEEAARLVASIRGDVAVVAAVGAYRSGKSYLLNQLGRLHRGAGAEEAGSFAVGHTVRPKSKRQCRVLLICPSLLRA